MERKSNLSDTERLNWLRLVRTENIGPITFHRLLQRFGTATETLNALPNIAAKHARKKPLVAAPLDSIERELESLHRAGGKILCAIDPDYPLALAAIEDAPPVISVIGSTDLLKRGCIGIVGARNASLNSKKFASILAQDLGNAGQTVVSGLARGIDTAAHEGSLKTGTVAVVAGGIDIIYPPENKTLYAHIAEGGLIVAESPFGMEPFAQSFPRRNRIISGLSQGVVVVEAGLRSGSLITARVAAEQGRDVFAVPGHPLDPRAEGTNTLLRDGAILVRNASDILNDIGKFSGGLLRDSGHSFYDAEPGLLEDLPANDIGDLTPIILDHLSTTPIHVDDLIRACGGHAGSVSGSLLTLELSGEVQRLPGNRVMRLS
ncbi:MAG: dprA [Micavibrio sp.]|nr:dprA [Micavibrio sp.]